MIEHITRDSRNFYWYLRPKRKAVGDGVNVKSTSYSGIKYDLPSLHPPRLSLHVMAIAEMGKEEQLTALVKESCEWCRRGGKVVGRKPPILGNSELNLRKK